MGVGRNMFLGGSPALAPQVSGRNSILFLGKSIDWNDVCVVGLSALFCWVSDRMGLDKMDNKEQS